MWALRVYCGVGLMAGAQLPLTVSTDGVEQEGPTVPTRLNHRQRMTRENTKPIQQTSYAMDQLCLHTASQRN
jgi:hypothetical protein